jgi:hypothetical protein
MQVRPRARDAQPFLSVLGNFGPRVPAHQITTRNLGAAYPFIAEAGLGRRWVVMGDDLLGGTFAYDPFEFYAQGVVSNPNMVVFGQIGRAKSAFIKTHLWRQAVFGRRAWVVDPKGEYGDLAVAVGRAAGGAQARRLGPAQPTRPGFPGPRVGRYRRSGRFPSPGGAAGVANQRVPGTSAAAARTRALTSALATTASRTGVATVPAVVDDLLAPTTESARVLRTERHHLLEDGRDVALELRRLVHGDLCGMFDGPTTPGLDLSAPLVVLDLSALYQSAALGVSMACATAWLQAALMRSVAAGASGGSQVFLVVDETWAILSKLRSQQTCVLSEASDRSPSGSVNCHGLANRHSDHPEKPAPAGTSMARATRPLRRQSGTP